MIKLVSVGYIGILSCRTAEHNLCVAFGYFSLILAVSCERILLVVVIELIVILSNKDRKKHVDPVLHALYLQGNT